MEPIRLSRAIVDQIIAHAREGKPEEVCGILRGRDGQVLELIRARNVAQDRIHDYTVDPQTLLKQFDFEEQGDAMVGIYHSHPVSPAYPSATDAWNAHYPESVYLIVSLERDDAPVLRAFRLLTHFLELDPEALRRALPFEQARPGLFAYFQPGDRPVPPVLQAVAEQAPPPFYLVFSTDETGEKVQEMRVVRVVEAPIQVE